MGDDESDLVDPKLRAILIGSGRFTGPSRFYADLAVEMTVDSPEQNLLIVPSATSFRTTHDGQRRAVASLFSETWGIKTDVLHDFLLQEDGEPDSVSLEGLPSRAELEERLGRASIIYVPGGDPELLMEKIWRPSGLDKLLAGAASSGTLVVGSSAGAMAWFETLELDGDPPMSGVGSIRSVIVSAHYNSIEKGISIEELANETMSKRLGRPGMETFGLGLDENAAFQIMPGGLGRALQPPNWAHPQSWRKRCGVYAIRPDGDSGVAVCRLEPGGAALPIRQLFEQSATSRTWPPAQS